MCVKLLPPSEVIVEFKCPGHNGSRSLKVWIERRSRRMSKCSKYDRYYSYERFIAVEARFELEKPGLETSHTINSR